MPAATPASPATTRAPAPAGGKSKLLTVALAFLFGSLASAQGIASILQLRLDPRCRHIADPIRIGCPRPGEAA